MEIWQFSENNNKNTWIKQSQTIDWYLNDTI